jgi:uncharacterized protein YqjF (DUF2071 family)
LRNASIAATNRESEAGLGKVCPFDNLPSLGRQIECRLVSPRSHCLRRIRGDTIYARLVRNADIAGCRYHNRPAADAPELAQCQLSPLALRSLASTKTDPGSAPVGPLRRTYVLDRTGRRGVWFFSLDAARWPAVVGARLAFGLPYYWARMSEGRHGETARYSSTRLTPPGASCRVKIEIGSPIADPSPLEVFLTARFRLYARRHGSVIMSEVSHQRWPLQQARICEMKQDLVRSARIPESPSPPLVHFSAGVDVLIAPPQPV